MGQLRRTDPQISETLQCEWQRQREKLILIASENYASGAVLEAQGSALTNKYAEGYPSRRYYGGCVHVDVAEQLAISRAKQLFSAEHANVQPHSGSQANLAAYLAILEHGDTVMAMSLKHGGHLTHGSPANLSGKLYNFIYYGVSRDTEIINYDDVYKLAREHKPKLIIAGTSSYPLTLEWNRFREIADEVGALFMVDMAHIAGMVAAGLHPNPVSYAQLATSTTHKTLRGPRGGIILCSSSLSQVIDSAVFPGMQGGPFMHTIAAKAVCFLEAMQPGFVEYQRTILANASAMADELRSQGLRLVSGGTDTHLVLVDLSSTGLTGQQAEELLEDVGIVVNRNAIPYDKLAPNVASGIRLGTPAVTTRGMGVNEIRLIARLITRILLNPDESCVKEEVRQEALAMCQSFPVYGIGEESIARANS